MRFKKFFCVISFISLTSTGCGLLGNKTPPEDLPKDVGDGCLNNAKNLFQRYAKGEVTETEWKSSFDCVAKSLDFFTQYVHGSSPNAYTQSDMYTFVSRFLITNNAIKPDLLLGAFELKEALLGGNSTDFTKEEIETFKSLLPRIRDITADMIPYLRAQQGTTDYQTYLDISDAFKHAGDQLATLINSLPVGVLSQNAVTLIIDQLASSLNIPVIDGLSTKAFIAKWVLFNTRPDAVEIKDWAQLIQSSMSLGGLAFAVYKAPHGDLMDDYHYRNFLWEVAKRARPHIEYSVAQHDGVIPFPVLDHVLDQLPNLVDIPPQILKQTLRPVIRKVLNSESKIGLDAGVIDSIYTEAELWVSNLELLDKLYEQMNLSKEEVTPAAFTTAMNQFALTLEPAQKVAFSKIKQTLLSYIPQFYKGTHMIRYQSGIGYTKFQHFFVLSIQQLTEHLLKAYGSGDGYFVDGDFQAMYKDLIDVLFAVKIFDPTVSNFAGKRFRDLDLFTPISNGDQKASTQEIVYYAMMMVSAGEMTTKLYNEVISRCDQNLGVDILGWKWIAAPCFRSEFSQRLDYWLDNFPTLKQYWSTLDAATKEKAMVWLEHGARRNGYNEDNFASFDFKAMPTILHYAESMFQTYNSSGGTTLSKADIMNAFPTFKNILKTKAPIDINNNGILKGLFTYIVKYREMPVINNAASIAKLVWWLAIWDLPTTHISTDRVGIFNIICQLAAPESEAQDKLTPEICKQ